MNSAAHIYGIDFSGASDAGAHIWIAHSTWRSNRLIVHEVSPAASLPNSSHDRAAAYAALRQLIANNPDGIFGLDFPFSLHTSQLGHTRWLSFVSGFAERYPDAAAFYQQMGGRGRELRRQTDSAAKTPFAPTNLRMYRQTYYGIRDLLAPLVLSGKAAAFPMQERQAGLATLIEVCPAVTLARHQLRLVGYKGRSSNAREQRAKILNGLRALGIQVKRSTKATVLENIHGDALDSLIAAYGAATALHEGKFDPPYSEIERLEGVVFF